MCRRLVKENFHHACVGHFPASRRRVGLMFGDQDITECTIGAALHLFFATFYTCFSPQLVRQKHALFCRTKHTYVLSAPIRMEISDFHGRFRISMTKRELQKKIIQTNMCSVPPNPCDEHSINQRIGGERRETILQFSMKSNSMPVARMGKVAVPDDDWVSIGRWMNLLSARDPNLRNFPPPCKFQRSSSVDGIMQRTTSFSPKTKRVSRDLSAPVRPYTIQVFVWL